jgi:hypothetical protein
MSAVSPTLTIEEAKALLKAGLGAAEIDFITSLTAPLYWVIRDGKTIRSRNGSTFFLDAGEGVFGVTAAHVLVGRRDNLAEFNVIATQIGHDLQVDIDSRIIALDEKIDIATFRITPEEIAKTGKTVLTGVQAAWPPSPPQRDKGIYFCGFAGCETTWKSPTEVIFGRVAGSGVASSISELDVSSLIERQYLVDITGNGLPAENYDFGGISGGPMLTVTELKGVRGWQLAGVIVDGPNNSDKPEEAIAGLEIIKARRARFIRRDGTLDTALWASLNPTAPAR